MRSNEQAIAELRAAVDGFEPFVHVRKEAFRHAARNALQAFANFAELDKAEYDVIWASGGISVSGEMLLLHDRFTLKISADGFNDDEHHVWHRKSDCRGVNSGSTSYLLIEDLFTPDTLALCK